MPSTTGLSEALRLRQWTLLVAAVALLATLNALPNQLAQDDPALILRNPAIQSIAGWPSVFASSYWPAPWEADLYRPLTSLLLGVQYLIGHGAPLVFRLVSVLLYVAASLGVLRLGRQVLPLGFAVAAALLFAAHPVHVEAVALGVTQNELVVGLLAVLMVARYLNRRRSAVGLVMGDWVLLGAGYVAACLFKETAFVIPGLLLAAEFAFLPGYRRRDLFPGFVGLAAVGTLVLALRFAVLGHTGSPGVADALLDLDAGGRLLTMLKVVTVWARLLVWPAHLQLDYSPQEIVASPGLGAAELGGLLLVLGAVALAWYARRRAPAVTFGLVWMAVALFPVSNVLIPTGLLVGERTLFLPSVGFVLALAGGAEWAFKLFPPSLFPSFPRLAIAATCIATLAGVARSAERFTVWRSDTSLTQRTAQDAPKSWRALRSLAHLEYDAGHPERAVALYEQAIALAPTQQAWRVRNGLAERYFQDGSLLPAVEQLRESLVEEPNKKQTWQYLILAYLAMGHYDIADRLADSALALGGAPDLFTELRDEARSALADHAPPGSIRINVQPNPDPRER